MLSIQAERPDQPEVAALLAALDDYLHSLYPPEANHIMGVRELLDPSVTFLVARRDGVAVGTGAVRRTHDADYGEIKRMYVTPALRGQRIAGQVLQHLERAARAQGLAWAMLETGADQTEAVRLYQRCGYTRRAAFGGYPDNGMSVFLAKPL
jgi:putative acetyltransferase